MKATPLDRFAEEQLQERLKRFRSQLRGAHKQPGDAKAIHDLRVAIRRLSQGLRVFRNLLDKVQVRKMRRRMRKIMELCGDARNCDVALDVLAEAGAPATRPLQRRVAARRRRAGRDLIDSLDSRNVLVRARHWREWLRPNGSKPAQTTASAARRILNPLSREFLETGAAAAQPESTPDAMHRFRLQAKRLRYTLEIFGPASGREWKHRIEQMAGLQEYLGAINDCVTTRDLVARLGGGGQPGLENLLEQRIAAFRLYWCEQFGKGNIE